MSRRDIYWEAEGHPAPEDRVEVEGGGWGWRLPDGFDPSTMVVGHHYLWAYDGQEVYADSASETFVESDELLVIGVEPEEIAFEDYLMTMVRVDGWGRRWVPVEVDLESIRTAVEETLPTHKRINDSGLPRGEEEYFQPQSWDHYDCDGYQANDTHIWDGEDRNRITSPNMRQEAVVQVRLRPQSDPNTYTWCSGTLVHSQNSVLTAAHCGYGQALDRIEVCRLSGLECRAVAQVQRNSAYTGTEWWEDWMVLELGGCISDCNNTPQSGWNTSVYHMDLSMQSDTDLGTITNVNKAGVPGYVLNSGGTCNGANLQNPQDLYHTNGSAELFFGHSQQVRYHHDGSVGDSGGPLYSCPGGANGQQCGGTEGASVFAVHSGFLANAQKYAGAKIPNAHRDAILAYLTD